MIFVCDLVRKKDEHRTLNEPVIKTAGKWPGPKQFILSSDSSSLIFLTELADSTTRIQISSGRLYRWVLINVHLFLILIKAIYKKNSKIIFTSLLPIHYLAIAVLSNIFNVKYMIFMHGELGYLKEARGLGRKIGAFCIRLAFKLLNQNNVTLAAISLPIGTNLRNLYPKLKNIEIFEHPPHAEEDSVSNLVSTEGGACAIGLFGVLSADKNSSQIYELASHINWNLLPKNSKLYTIGLSDGSFEFGQSPYVEHLFSGRLGEHHIPWDVFSVECKKLNWALFFYNSGEKYGMIPSGVFFDCIHWHIPVLSVDNQNFSLYFKKYGDLGFLANDITDLAAIVQRIFAGELNPDQFNDGFVRARADMSADKFESTINSFLGASTI
jgi:hypothetical protein